MYGRDSIHARQPTFASIGAIQRSDLQAFAAAWERPDAAAIGIVGDIDAKQASQLVQSVFGGAQLGCRWMLS